MTVNREVRGKGKRFGVWACRRVGVGGTYRRARRIDGFSAQSAFKVRECSQRVLIADTPLRRHADTLPRSPSLRRNSPARLLDLRSVFFRFSDLAPERPRPLGIAAPFLFARRPALGGLPFTCFFDQ
jgi:hypothetical protein